jgi:hypothetical protein
MFLVSSFGFAAGKRLIEQCIALDSSLKKHFDDFQCNIEHFSQEHLSSFVARNVVHRG